ncbi:L-ascorbate oxidase [Escovopsis weberi]|uniref:L-ascorbate oxidase n=1 Tax=Escovopsis weberi TaxID=150374 RepID=A0A0M9VT32_ESCWE|nr:L-ascorbate oxidase [Escovopsis weberi]
MERARFRAWACICLGLIFESVLSKYTSVEPRVHGSSFKPDEVLCVTRKNISVGGIFRYTTLVNGSLPGPVLRLPEDKVIWHWHGLTQAVYPFSDGSPLASQWPIPPSHYFDYELKVDGGVSGTYFYHSHIDFQSSTASGPLIIKESAPAPYKVYGERIIHIQELWNSTDDDILAGLEATSLRWLGETNGILINGNTIVNHAVVDPSSARLSVIEVEPGQTYRFRFIGATSLSHTSLAFEEHPDLDVIEVDGGYTKAHRTELLQIGSGQRFSTLFRTKTCEELKKLGRLDFYIQIESRERPTVVTNYAVLRYGGANCSFGGEAGQGMLSLSTTSYPRHPPLKLPPTIAGFLDYKLEPLYPNDFPSAAEVTRRVYLDAQQVVNGWLVWRSNNVSWADRVNGPLGHVTPAEPYLVSLYRDERRYMPDYDAAVANGGLDESTGTYPARIGEVIEVVVQQLGSLAMDGSSRGGALDTHPWHVHGRPVYDVGGGPGAHDPAEAERLLAGTTPLLRDTTILYRYTPAVAPGQVQGWRAWRLRVESPGVWMIHCHTLQHMISGMQTVWVFGDREDLLRVGRPAVSGYLEYGGSVTGNAERAPEVIHFSELEAYHRDGFRGD